jgi:uncharacterized protein
MKNGVYLKFFAYELEKHNHQLVYEWVLEFAKKNGISGGSVFRAIAGFGRKKKLHEEHFFELGSNVPIEIVFILPEEEASRLLDLLGKEKIDLLFMRIPVEYGVT